MHKLHRHFPHEAIRLERWHRLALYGLLLLLFVSGIALLLLRGMLGNWAATLLGSTDDPESQAHRAAAWVVVFHGSLMLPALLLTGALINSHIRKAWRLHRNRWSGGIMVAVMLVLLVTAELLYYAGGDSTRGLASASHWIAGLLLLPALPAHIIAGRWVRQRMQRARQAEMQQARKL